MRSSMKIKNHINNRLAGVLYLTLLLAATSCGKYLDVTPENTGTIDYAFRNRNEAENYLFACYNTLQSLASNIDDPGFITSGELYKHSYDVTLNTRNFLLISGTQNTSSPILDYWTGQNGGKNIFQGIRRCNIMLENIDKPIDLTASEKERWMAEVNFLKAYYHFFLLRMYGPIPVMDRTEDISQPVEVFRNKRQPVDSVFSYITGLLDKAIPGLPPSISNINQELGRITKTIALSVKAEVLATQASPLFNGNPDYANYKDKDGVALFPGTADNSKWQRAAEACKAAITQAEGLGLKLYSFIVPPAIPKLNDSLRVLLSIQNAVTERWELNSELVWALNGVFSHQQNCIPRFSANGNYFNVPGDISVPLAIAELFYTRNGVPIEEDKTWDYPNRFAFKVADPADRYYLKEGYSTTRFNFDREARYYSDIGFDGGTWFGAGVLKQEAMLYVAAKKGSLSGVQEYGYANVTGYWPKKLVHYMTAYNTDGGLQKTDFRMPRTRLADLYLLYAECLNEANGPSQEAYTYIDKVRARANLNGVVTSWQQYSSAPGKPLAKEGLREIIHRERRIELCFEGKAGWDLRRWKKYVSQVSMPIQGWNVMQSDQNAYYTLQTYLVPVISNKDYLWPLSGDALLTNDKWIQSPFW